MRRLALLAIALMLQASAVAQVPQARPPQADGVVRLLSQLEDALMAGSLEDFQAIASATLPAGEAARFRAAIVQGPAVTAAVRERARRPVSGGYEILAEVLVGHGRRGRVATWQIEAHPRAGQPDRFELTSLTELASVDGLVRLTLDTSRQFAVRDFLFEAPDFALRMSSGAAFVAESPGGVTAIVLRGRGEVEFAPADPAEQGQLRLFAGDPDYRADIDSAFLRLNPGEYSRRISEGALVQAAAVDGGEARRAQDVFDELSPRTYNLDLADLSSERWSLEPGFGSLVVELRSRRHGWLTYAKSPNEHEDITFFDRDERRNLSVYASEAKLAERGPDYSEDDDASYDVERYELDLSFEPTRSWVSGRATVHLRVRRGQVSTITMRLDEALTISSVSSAELGRLLTLRVIGQNNVIISLPRPAYRDDRLSFDFSYSGRLDPQALDREAIQVVGAQEGERTILLPEYRYLYSNRLFWYPQNEASDYATAHMRLSVPSEYQVVASGSFAGSSMSEVLDESTGQTSLKRTSEYVTDRPVRYLACVISRFVPIEQIAVPVPAVAPPAVAGGATAGAGTASVNVEVVSTPRMTGRNRDMPEVVGDMIQFYAEAIGEAPYPDFTLAGIDDNLPGGHSPAYFAILHQPLPTTPFLWSSDPVAFDHIYDDFFLAHEVAHQWWGQAIGWKNYHEQWLSEGLAQYFAALYAGQTRGADMLYRLLEQMRRTAEPLASQGPISLGYRLGHIQKEGRVFRAVVYNKSAVVLHTLRRLIGDEAFFWALQDFYREYRFSKTGTAELRQAFEARSGRSLERFFDRWIRGAALPDLDVDSRIDNDRGTVIVRVRQRGEVFDMPLRLEIEYEDREREAVEITLSEDDEEFMLPLRARARRVEVKDELVLGRIRS